MGAPRDETPKADWTFTIPNVDGQFFVRVTGLPDDWMVSVSPRAERTTPIRRSPFAAGSADIRTCR